MARGIRFACVLIASLAGPSEIVRADAAIERFAEAVRFETISHEREEDFDAAPFLALHAYLEGAFPGTHATLEREVVADYSLLYTWRGSDSSAPPILITAHLDVVPVPESTLDAWEHPPFEGVVADGYLWGRGTLDDKVGVLAALEATERLVAAGFAPTRTIYLAFGHDEEIGGDRGAGAITDLLASRGVRLWFSLDEGMAIVSGFAGLDQPAAMIGIAEKGYANLRLTTRAKGGHSSVPPPNGAIPRLARAVSRLDENPLPARMEGVAPVMLDAIAPHMSGLTGFMLRQRWLFGPLVMAGLGGDPATSAMIRTTTAVTLIDGGVKANVLPRSASATVNFRIIPGDTEEAFLENVREIVDDPEVEIDVLRFGGASEVASTTSDAYQALSAAIRSIDPELIIAPALVLGGTDSKHYARISADSYRFTPMRLGLADTGRLHGVNERIAIEGYPTIIAFYESLLRNAAGSAR